ncbi:hypothetical protein I6B53_01495 [Schaalia sp. 19OD2882]|uniref:hypothetical protein n=1 Tax=Schaalia sp. 19OD2882 TaxID=2794089 RepID=UPI001C1ECB38|nr:hypothetical protein [Schaalia sp. 19OD2882]QWW19833.1 hypothetical protein I6B53_01495 [Schaalia sp. 19OD2882]
MTLLSLSISVLGGCGMLPAPLPPPLGPGADGGESSTTRTSSQGGGDSVVKWMVGRPMYIASGSVKAYQKSFTLNQDGTVTADPEVLPFIGRATHWRGTAEILDFCTDKTCKTYAEWRVSADNRNIAVILTLETSGQQSGDTILELSPHKSPFG